MILKDWEKFEPVEDSDFFVKKALSMFDGDIEQAIAQLKLTLEEGSYQGLNVSLIKNRIKRGIVTLETWKKRLETQVELGLTATG